MHTFLDNFHQGGKYYSSQLTYWILDLGATCHRTPAISDFIPGSLEYTDKYIEVADGHHVTAGKKGQVRIKMCEDNRKTFITQFAVDQLDFGFGNNVPYDARSFGFHSRIIRIYG